MQIKNVITQATKGLLFSAFVMLATTVTAQNHVEGKLEVNGKAVAITQIYAYATEGFFDKKKQDVIVLLCDAQVPAEAVRDIFKRRELVEAGKLRCVKQVINAEKQVINFEVQDRALGSIPESGGSSWHVFEAKSFDGKTIAGRARTTSPQKSFANIPYSYDITFSAAIEPKE